MIEAFELAQLGFVQRMMIAGLLASLACGIIGTYVVVKKIVFVSGGIAHSTFGGIGLAYYLQYYFGWQWFDPLFGAVIFALSSGVILSSNWIREKVREDSTIGIIWVSGMAVGALFLSLVNTNQVTVQSPSSILFGNILLIGSQDLILMLVLDLVIVVVTVLLYRDFQLLTFDETFAKVTGVNVKLLNLLLFTLISLTVVILIKVVGVVLILAMLTIPAATSNLYTDNLKNMMILSIILTMVMTTIGIFISLSYDVPPGSTIVLLMFAIFLTSLTIKKYQTQRITNPSKDSKPKNHQK